MSPTSTTRSAGDNLLLAARHTNDSEDGDGDHPSLKAGPLSSLDRPTLIEESDLGTPARRLALL